MALASRLQAKQKEVDRLMMDNKNLQKKISEYESDAKMYKKLANKQDMPTKYLL
jgi:chromosome segregation ATPase